MKIPYDDAELYPVYLEIEFPYKDCPTIDISEELLERWRAVMKEFWEVQEIIEKIVEGESDGDI